MRIRAGFAAFLVRGIVSAAVAAAGATAATPREPASAAPAARVPDRAPAPDPPLEAITYPSDGLRITGWLCKPDGPGPFPLVLVNHGGFELARTVGPLLGLFARLGYVAVASDYRGVGGSEGRRELAKGEVSDVLNAIVFARGFSYVDGRRVVMWGHSHGGCIALLAAARAPDIVAVVTIGAPVELAECYRHWVRTVERVPVLKPLIGVSLHVGGTPNQVPDAWKLRSPLYVAGRIKCPVLMVQGGKDDAVPPAQARRMVAALQAAGNRDARLLFDAEAGHVLDAKAYERLGNQMINFLNEQVGLPPTGRPDKKL
jgi:dipeptidyl aminopeptidase/acylaminoacyl peptidase